MADHQSLLNLLAVSQILWSLVPRLNTNLNFQMFDWVYHNREEFLVNYVEIGHSYQVSKDLQEAHSQFTVACQVRTAGGSCARLEVGSRQWSRGSCLFAVFFFYFLPFLIFIVCFAGMEMNPF